MSRAEENPTLIDRVKDEIRNICLDRKGDRYMIDKKKFRYKIRGERRIGNRYIIDILREQGGIRWTREKDRKKNVEIYI